VAPAQPSPERDARDDAEGLQARADAIGWYHSIDLGNGVVTKGQSENRVPRRCFPGLSGRTVLDIGAWDGYYSFFAEREGAARVVALDHYMWGIDFGRRAAYWDECAATGVLPDHGRDTTDFWRPDLPGKRGFDFAREALGSRVEDVVADFATMDLEPLGTFDVVFYFGVLYHMREPLACLERVRRVTREVAVIETEAMEIGGLADVPIATFRAGNEINGDFGNWWVANLAALRELLRAAGFARVQVCEGPPAELAAPDEGSGAASGPRHYRVVVSAFP
jgi:tRNA (mo5U34)-methyltransferase